jgi:NADH:ubiquinone oxidoreductase subunit
MVGWGVESLLSGKFWKVFKKEGFIKAWERGRATRVRPIHDNTGARDVVPLVGTDPLGNRYYEDFFADDSNDSHLSTRWVEPSDRSEVFISGRKIPPEWHGWLAHTYDEAPVAGNTSFYTPVFKKPHLPNSSGQSNAWYPTGHQVNEYRTQLHKFAKSRMYTAWNPAEASIPKKRYD